MPLVNTIGRRTSQSLVTSFITTRYQRLFGHTGQADPLRCFPAATNHLPANCQCTRGRSRPIGQTCQTNLISGQAQLFYHKFCSACAVTVVIFGYLNGSFYLLTYNLAFNSVQYLFAGRKKYGTHAGDRRRWRGRGERTVPLSEKHRILIVKWRHFGHCCRLLQAVLHVRRIVLRHRRFCMLCVVNVNRQLVVLCFTVTFNTHFSFISGSRWKRWCRLLRHMIP